MKRHIRRIVRPCVLLWRLGNAAVSDGLRFWRHSGTVFLGPGAVKSELLKTTHSLEKGLVIPGSTRVFGEEKIVRLRKLLEALPADAANQWLHGYVNAVIANVERHNRLLGTGHPAVTDGQGVTRMEKAAVLASLPPSPEAFFSFRRSVREYSEEKVSPDILRRAVTLAQQAPSVCNRQSGRVRFYTDEKQKAVILDLHVGNRGFGHLAPVVAVVSSDISTFHHVGERNQPFVDGGLFSLALGFALHSLGLGACMLNWSVLPDRDRQLRSVLGIPETEVIIMLMSIGHLPQRYQVAESRRRPVEEVWLNCTAAKN